VVEGWAVGDNVGISEGLGDGIPVEGDSEGAVVGITEGLGEGDNVGDLVGVMVGKSVGRAVGIGEGADVGTEVFGQRMRLITVMLTSLPKSTQCPMQLSNPMVCHNSLSGMVVDSTASSKASTVPLILVRIHR